MTESASNGGGIPDWSLEGVRRWLATRPPVDAADWTLVAARAIQESQRSDRPAEHWITFGELAVYAFDQDRASGQHLSYVVARGMENEARRDYDVHRWSELLVRARLIALYGPSAGTVRDREHLETSIAHELEKAAGFAHHVEHARPALRTLPPAAMYRLRMVKCALNAVQVFLDSPFATTTPAINWWRARRDRLP